MAGAGNPCIDGDHTDEAATFDSKNRADRASVAQRERFNTLAVVAFILTFASLCSPVTMVLGYIARRQILRTGERGIVLARISMVVGAFFTSPYLVIAALILLGL